MPNMSAAYLNAIRDHGKTLITHMGLVDNGGAEISGGSPAYARQPVTWINDGDGVMRPDANITFNIPAGATVGGWRGYGASSGGTDYGGKSLTNEVFAGQGEYTILQSQTSISHTGP